MTVEKDCGNESPTSVDGDGADADATLVKFMDSFMKITLAGFGGALAGMSMSRSSVMGTRRTPRKSGNLTMTWAMACMAFAGVVEASRVVSPTSQVLDALDDDSYPSTRSSSSARTIGDTTIGGMVAGAMMRGNIRPKAPPLALGTRMGAGMALGLMAGVGQVGIEYLINQLEQSSLQSRDEENESS